MTAEAEDRRVLSLRTLTTAKEVRRYVQLRLLEPEFQEVLKRRPGLRSGILKRQATKQTTILRTSYSPPTLFYNADANPRTRWRSLPPTGPAHIERTSAVDDGEVRRLTAIAVAGDGDARSALHQLANDLQSVGRSRAAKRLRSIAGPPRGRGKRGPDPTSRHLLRVAVFDLLLELQWRGIKPTTRGAKIVAEEVSQFRTVSWTSAAVIEIWYEGLRAVAKENRIRSGP